MSEETAKYLIAQGGFAVLFLIASSVAVYFWKHIRKQDEDFSEERAEWDKQRLAFFEARLLESGKVQSALESNTRALQALESSSQTRAAAVQAVSQLLSALVEKTDARDVRYSGALQKYDQRLEAIDRTAERIVRMLEWSQAGHGPRP